VGEGSLGRGGEPNHPLPSSIARLLVDTRRNTDILVKRLYITRSDKVKRNRQVKFGVFKCQCGCGEDFTGEYVTRAPRYKDKKHRNRKLAANKAAARVAKSKELFRLYKERRIALRAAGIKSKRLIEFASVLPNPDYTLVFRDLLRHVPQDASARDD